MAQSESRQGGVMIIGEETAKLEFKRGSMATG